MKYAYALIPLALFALNTADATAQTRIWRCGMSSYTNDEAQAKSQGCKLVEGGNVTIVQGTRVNGPAKTVSVAKAPNSESRIDAGEQKARDNEARAILETELKKSQARLADLQKEYNGGQPEMLGPEHRNYAKYQERTASLKADIERTQNDIDGLQRELARTGAPSATR
jgi:hypothetical protein